MYFCSKTAEEKLKTYKMSYFGGAFYIDYNGQITSFCAPPIKDEDHALLREVIKAFLLSNPEGLHRIVSAGVADCHRHSGLKNLLTYIEVVSNRLSGDITNKAFWDPYFDEFNTLRRYPTPIDLGAFTSNVPEYLNSYDIQSPYYWEVDTLAFGHGLIQVKRTNRESGEALSFSCTSESGYVFMTPSIFREAMKTVLALDHDAFFDAYNVVKERFESTESAWTPWYFQMCLMIDVFKNYERKLMRASRFCPWITYD